jgi:hypothetical protein
VPRLAGAPPEGRQWNGRKVADWLSEHLGRPVHRQRGWEKNLHHYLAAICAAHLDTDVQLWGMDEHRLELHPVLRRVWFNR